MNINSLYLLILLVGCIKTEKKNILEISPEYFVDQEVTLSDIGEDIKYIPISSDVLFPHIISIEITDSLMFIGAARVGLIEYNTDGEFIRKIGRRGKGPGEYRYGTNFTLDEINQRVYIRDQNKILVSDFDGKLIREITSNAGSKISFNNNKLYLFGLIGNNEYANPQHYWTVLDTLGNVLYSKRNTTKGFLKSNSASGTRCNLRYKYNNKIYYWNQYNDTIFQLKDTLYKAAYLFKEDVHRLTPENSAIEANLFGINQYYVINYLIESQHYLFLKFRQYGKSHFCIYDKQEEVFKNNTSNDKHLRNDIDAGLPFSLEEVINFRDNEYLLSWIEAIELKAHVASKVFKNSTPKHPEKKRELEKLAKKLTVNDNPVLILVKLKE